MKVSVNTPPDMRRELTTVARKHDTSHDEVLRNMPAVKSAMDEAAALGDVEVVIKIVDAHIESGVALHGEGRTQ